MGNSSIGRVDRKGSRFKVDEADSPSPTPVPKCSSKEAKLSHIMTPYWQTTTLSGMVIRKNKMFMDIVWKIRCKVCKEDPNAKA